MQVRVSYLRRAGDGAATVGLHWNKLAVQYTPGIIGQRRREASLTRLNVGEIMFSRISWTRKERWGDAVHRCRSPEPGTVLVVTDLESVAWRAVTAGRLTATIAGAPQPGAAAGPDVPGTPGQLPPQAQAAPTKPDHPHTLVPEHDC